MQHFPATQHSKPARVHMRVPSVNGVKDLLHLKALGKFFPAAKPAHKDSA
jgi:hypothetical protein